MSLSLISVSVEEGKSFPINGSRRIGLQVYKAIRAGAAKTAGLVIPDLQAKFTGMALSNI